MLIVEGWIRFAPGEIDRLREAMQAALAATRQEPGCLSYAMSVDVAEPTLLRIAELWEDEAALKAHARAPHVAAFMTRLRDVNVEGMSIKVYAGAFERTLMER